METHFPSTGWLILLPFHWLWVLSLMQSVMQREIHALKCFPIDLKKRCRKINHIPHKNAFLQLWTHRWCLKFLMVQKMKVRNRLYALQREGVTSKKVNLNFIAKFPGCWCVSIMMHVPRDPGMHFHHSACPTWSQHFPYVCLLFLYSSFPSPVNPKAT